MLGIIGRKIGMTQVFDAEGNIVPVTALQAGPCVVVQVRTPERDGYSAVQLGLLEPFSKSRYTQPLRGHVEKAGVPAVRVLREFRLEEGQEPPGTGAAVRCDVFRVGELVDVRGIGKGKGFQGFVKRHHFKGGAATHGSMFHRAPGSLGGSSYPSRVWPGQRMAGHMGARQVTTQRLEVVQVDPENHILLVKGAVPGARNTIVTVRRSLRQKKVHSEGGGNA